MIKHQRAQGIEVRLYQKYCDGLDFDSPDIFNKAVYSESSRVFMRACSGYFKNYHADGFKAGVLEKERLACEIKNSLSKICGFYKANEEKFKDVEEAEIIRAVAETLQIKCESIVENTEIFKEECVTFIGNADKERFFEAEFRKFNSVVLDEFINGLKNLEPWDKRGTVVIRRILKSLQKGSGRQILILRDKAEKFIARNNESFGKKMISFQKDCLFFEISTFEEIMHYSISRLRESENKDILGFVGCVDEVSTSFEEILERHNILLIRPKVYEMFNGREHEVLMAEEHEGFKKGEIIKLLNSGYKQGDGVVILRANVIAAK